MALTHLTDDLFRRAIGMQDQEFDAHDVIRYFYRAHQAAYVRELARRVDVESFPFTETNRLIGVELTKYSDVIERVGDAFSLTIGGESTQCARWRKR